MGGTNRAKPFGRGFTGYAYVRFMNAIFEKQFLRIRSIRRMKEVAEFYFAFTKAAKAAIQNLTS